jgi:hypothetical protein
MSSVLFPASSESFQNAQINLASGTIRAALIREGVSTTAIKPVTGATNATPIVLTVTGHGWSANDFIVVNGVGGNGAANGLYRIANPAANTVELQTSLDGGQTYTNVVGSGAYTSGGWAMRVTGTTFLSDFTSAKVGTDQTLASKTTNVPLPGVADAADPTWSAVADPGSNVVGVLVFLFGSNDADSRVIGWQDGRVAVTTAAAAATSATSLAIEPLQFPLASGASAVFSNGVTATLTAPAARGARTLAVSALAAGIAAGHSAQFVGDQSPNQALPIRPNGGSITLAIDSGFLRLWNLRSYGLG